MRMLEIREHPCSSVAEEGGGFCDAVSLTTKGAKLREKLGMTCSELGRMFLEPRIYADDRGLECVS